MTRRQSRLGSATSVESDSSTPTPQVKYRKKAETEVDKDHDDGDVKMGGANLLTPPTDDVKEVAFHEQELGAEVKPVGESSGHPNEQEIIDALHRSEDEDENEDEEEGRSK